MQASSSDPTSPLPSFSFKTLLLQASHLRASTSWGCVTKGELLDFSLEGARLPGDGAGVLKADYAGLMKPTSMGPHPQGF